MTTFSQTWEQSESSRRLFHQIRIFLKILIVPVHSSWKESEPNSVDDGLKEVQQGRQWEYWEFLCVIREDQD